MFLTIICHSTLLKYSEDRYNVAASDYLLCFFCILMPNLSIFYSWFYHCVGILFVLNLIHITYIS